MLDLTYQHQATTQLYVQALIGIFFLVSVKGYLYLCRYDAGSHNISGDVSLL